MAFTVQDYTDLVRLLAEHPEWRPELRQLVLSDELLSLPEIVRELAAAQRQSEARLTRLETVVAELTEAQRQSEARLAGVEARLTRLETVVAELTEAQKRTEARLEELARHVLILADEQKRLADTVSDLKGRALEADYRDKVTAYFGRLLRRPQVVSLNSLWDILEARLSGEALDDLLLVDLVVHGRPRRPPEWGEVWLAVEVATVVNQDDVARARRRAGLLRQAGYPAVPLVAGESLTLTAEADARDQKVAVLQDGHAQGWEEALAAIEDQR